MAKSKTAFLDIDTQHDFMDPAGALYMRGAEKIVGNLKRLVRHAAAKGIPLLSSMDSHIVKDPEFMQFPAHCVIGSPGQRKIDETLLPNAVRVPPKPGALPREIAPGTQVIFEKPTLYLFDNPNFLEYIKREGFDEFVVFGVATDYCVQIAAEGLVERGCKVTVVRDAIHPVDPKAGKKSLESMKKKGVKFATTKEIAG
jgi:nicotinamidase/pyrazinamidase